MQPRETVHTKDTASHVHVDSWLARYEKPMSQPDKHVTVLCSTLCQRHKVDQSRVQEASNKQESHTLLFSGRNMNMHLHVSMLALPPKHCVLIQIHYQLHLEGKIP